MILLKATTESIKVVTSSTAGIDYSVSWVDVTTTSFVPSSTDGKITTATTTTILAAPAVSTQRQVKLITITNIHATTANTVTVLKDISGTTYQLTPATVLAAGSCLLFLESSGWDYKSGTLVAAAGSDTQIQFNNSGVLTGDGDLTWDNSSKTLALGGTDTEIVMKGISNEPSAPSAGNLTVYSKAIAGRMQLKIKGPSGLDSPLQSDVKQNGLVGMLCDGVAWGTTIGAIGGTAAAVLPSTTNLYTAMRRTTYASLATTQNQQLGRRASQYSREFGINFVCRFGFDSIKTGMRAFIGLSSQSALVSVNPSTAINTIGFGFDLGDTEVYFIHNDGTGTAIKESIPGQGTLATNNVGYDAYIFCKPGDNKVYYRLDRVDTSVTVLCDSFVTEKIPYASSYCYVYCLMSNGTANTVVGDAKLGINKLLIETDL